MTWSYLDYSINPDLNVSINGIDIGEFSPAAGYNNALRQMMSDIKGFTVAYTPPSYPVSVANGGTGGTDSVTALAGLNALSATYRQLPQSAKNAGFTLDLTQSAAHVYYTGGAATCTIPPNSSVPFIIGTAITIVNNGSGALAISRGAGVALKWAATNTDADRTLAVGGMAALLKVGTDLWFISGAALT